MTTRCDLCGKGPRVGSNISHSKVHTKRRWLPNVHAATVVVDGQKVRANLCSRCVRSIQKLSR